MMNVLNIRCSSVLASGTSKYRIHSNSDVASVAHFASEQLEFEEVTKTFISRKKSEPLRIDFNHIITTGLTGQKV